MGILFSCLRIRQYGREESKPLLSSETPENSDSEPPLDLKSLSKKLIHILAALKSGKLPSQAQINVLIRAALKSNLLFESHRTSNLSPAGRKVLLDLRQFLGLVMVFGQERNYDDKIQDIILHARFLTYSEDLIILEPASSSASLSSRITSELETDLPLFLSSISTLLSLFLTSTAFRILFGNLLLLTRQYFVSSLVQGVQKVEDIAGQVESVTEAVQNVAERAVHIADQVHGVSESIGLGAASMEGVAKDTEHTILDLNLSSTIGPDTMLEEAERLKDRAEDVVEHTVHGVKQVQFESQPSVQRPRDLENSDTIPQRKAELDLLRAKVGTDQAEERKNAIATSVQKILLHIHEDPAQISALRTIISLSRKWLDYYRNFRSSKLGESFDIPDTSQWRQLYSFLKDTKELVERLAGGKSLDPLLHSLEDVVTLQASYNEEENGESEVVSDLVSSFNRIASMSLGMDDSHSNAHSHSGERGYISSDSFRRDVWALIEKIHEFKETKDLPTSSSAPTASMSSNNFMDASVSEPKSASRPKLLALQRELDTFLSSLRADYISRRLLHGLISLGQDVEKYLRPSSDMGSGNRHRHRGRNSTDSVSSVLIAVLNDAFGYIVPKVISGIVDSFFGKNAVNSHTTTDYNSNIDAGYSEQVTKEWNFPLPLPRLELVSETSTSSSGSSSRWLEGVLDPRLMHIRVQDDEIEEVHFEGEEGAFPGSTISSSFRWWCCCCCWPERDPYLDAEAGYVVVPMQPAHISLANLLTPSSIVITQWNETLIDFYSSVPPVPVAVDSEPLLIDVTVPGEEPRSQAPAVNGEQHVHAYVSNPKAMLPSQNPVEDEHLVVMFEDESGSETQERTRTAIKSTNKMRLHMEGILSSLPSVPTVSSHTTTLPTTTLIKTKTTRRLTLENIGYYARYNLLGSIFGSWLHIGDEGLLDLEFEFRDSNRADAHPTMASGDVGGDGAVLDMVIELNVFTDEDEDEEAGDLPPFKVSDVHFTLPHTVDIIPRLRMLPNSTLLDSIISLPRNFLFSLFLRPVVFPLAKVVVRRELEKIIAQGIQSASEGASRMGKQVVQGARRRAKERAHKAEADTQAAQRDEFGDESGQYAAKISLGDIWSSFVEALEEMTAWDEDVQPEVEVNTKVKGVGIQFERTAVKVDSDQDRLMQDQRRAGSGYEEEAGNTDTDDAAPTISTTTIAVGLAPQLLPDKATSVLPSANPAEAAEEVIAETQTAVQTIVDGALDGAKDGLKQGFDNILEGARKAADVAEGVREGVEEVREGDKEREAESMKERDPEIDGGWRSTVFDL